MSRPYPDPRWRSRAFARTIFVGLAISSAACSDSPTRATSPLYPSRDAAVTASLPATDPLSSRLAATPGSCVVSLRMEDGGYRSRSIKFALPGVESPAAHATRLAYRGWIAGVAEPALMMVCTVSDASPGTRIAQVQWTG